ncbi:hypothetical protein [Afifella aestuarii]|uniref:hypothetical protein n=1 Tax=Afifella aestuarii TaxID=1909496 RepID=UPI000FE40617|nr:hypothetical protein [Afifella aestuarii]
MRDLQKALADIDEIRNQMAAATAFRGFGPGALATTGVLAFFMAAAQQALIGAPLANPIAFFGGWIATAMISAIIIGVEMAVRTRRHHAGLADAMLYNAVQQFLPAGAAGALLTLAIARVAPQALWMLPGLWLVFVSLGVFASARSLPRGIHLAGVWYFVSGFVVLALASEGPHLSPWMMGIPFSVGQVAIAAILYFAPGEADG